MAIWRAVKLMKKLTKIKLVNWHLFSNQTIDISDNTLISGENGSGKSTLLDAMQYLLVGGKAGAKFNIAATDDARRTLEGYIRGRIGAENKEHLRGGDVITHLALEFFDEQAKAYSIIGVILDLPKASQLKERFYLIEGLSIHEDMFIENKYPRDFKSMKTYLRTLDIDFHPFETQKKYRDALARFFGMDARKYAKILPKALAFRPIDLQAFVFEFLLDDDPIDIQSLKNNVAQLKKVEAQIKRDREKLEKLEQISKLGEEIKDNKDQLIINGLIDQLNWVEMRETYIKQNEDRMALIDQQIEALRDEKARIDEAIEQNDKAISNLERYQDDNDLARSISTYKEQLLKKEQQLNEQKEVLSELKRILVKEFDTIKELMNLVPSQTFKGFVQYFQSNEGDLEPFELVNHLTMVARDVQSYLQAYHSERTKTENEKQKLSDEIQAAQLRLNGLKKHVKTYPNTVEALIEVLNTGLSDRYQKQVRVRPLCELIEVNDELWRNAIEGYLNTQRFDIIVDPSYFDDALEIYEQAKTEMNIYGVGLVNTTKLAAYDQVIDGTLASKITTDYKYARYYINMMLNTIFCVENVHDLKNFSRAITPSAMTYSNYTARQINPRVYQTPYIGQRATEIQIQIEVNDLRQLETKMEKYYDLSLKQEKIMRLLEQSRASQVVHQNQIRYFEDIKKTRKEYAQLEIQLEALSKDPSLSKLREQMEKELIMRKQLRIDSDRIVGEIATARGEKERLINQIEDVKVKLELFSKEQRELSQKHPEKLSQAHTQFFALKTRLKGNHDAVSEYLAKSNAAIHSQTTKAEIELIGLMKSYIQTYHFSAAPSFEYLDQFEQEANIIRNNNLVKYEQEATDLRKSSEIGFKEEFVNKLRASIENAQQQISELNLALKGKLFGTDTYQLITRASEDPEYKMYYNLIMGNDAFEKQTLFTEGLSKRNEHILTELFDKIASSDAEHDHLNYAFLDYRNYMSYDIEVIDQNGNKSYFSKVSREKSGGETQVPFYIVIAASFQQLLTRNKRIDSGCIVLFDEAFNNMDESRIDAMMKFYSTLSIQLVIAVPPQRVSNIINYVNTSLIIVKEDDYAIVEAFKDHRTIA